MTRPAPKAEDSKGNTDTRDSRSAFARLDALAQWPLGATIIALAIGTSTGLTLGSLWAHSWDYTHDNDVLSRPRGILTLFVVLALVFVGTAYARRWSAAFRATSGTEPFDLRMRRAHEELYAANRDWCAVLALPLFPFIFSASSEIRNVGLTLTFIVAIGAIAATATYHRVKAAPLQPRATEARSRALTAVVVIGLAWTLFIGRLAILRHHGLASRIFDLAIYDSLFAHASHGEGLATNFVLGGHHASAHFDPILILLSPIYRLYPHAETLLVLQAVWIGSGIVPVYLLARRKLPSEWMAVAVAALWCLQPTLQSAALYDFHSLALCAPLVPWLVFLLESKRPRALVAMCALTLLVREDMALLMCGFGAFVFASGYGSKLATAIVVGSLAWLAFVKFAMMPDPGLFMSGPKAYGYADLYGDLIPEGTGALGLLQTVVMNPVFVLSRVFIPEKFVYLGKIFAPFLFLPLVFAGRSRILLGYGLAFSLLATSPHIYSVDYQYPVVLTPAVVVATLYALSALPRSRLLAFMGASPSRLLRGTVVGLLVTSLLVGVKFGALAPNAAIAPGYKPVFWYLTDEERARYEFVKDCVARVPNDATFALSDRLGPHASNRPHAHRFEARVTAEYALVDPGMLVEDAKRSFSNDDFARSYELLVERFGIRLYRRRAGALEAPAKPGGAN